MRKLRALTFSILLGISFQVNAQELRPHSLAVGLQNGVATVTGFELYSAAISLDLNHQRNITDFFSWRTGLGSSYVFPVKYQFLYAPPVVHPSRVQKASYAHIGLTTMPLVYHRDEGFALFAGLGGGIGLQFETIENLEVPLDGGAQKVLSNSTTPYFTLGWKPVIGVSFDLGTRNSGNELELSLSRESWWTINEGRNAPPFYWYAFEITYRHNFKE